MKGRYSESIIAIVVVTVVLLLLTAAIMLFGNNYVVMSPAGTVGEQQRNLMVMATVIMSVVVVPVFALLFFIAWKYRAGNTKAKYQPTWDKNNSLEVLWWGIPIAVVVFLSIVVWQTSHSLDPFRALTHSQEPVRVQAVALQWKWLFIYPDEGVASVGDLPIPVNRPINFEIAADAPMNSFWIPELGGQIYAMNGMSTRLHLIANRTGEFRGVSSNISGEGFADMKFKVRSIDSAAFTTWVADTKSHEPLSIAAYDQLHAPSVLSQPQYYRLEETGLYRMIINKYMLPHSGQAQTNTHEGAH